jgi:hypothetical protein
MGADTHLTVTCSVLSMYVCAVYVCVTHLLSLILHYVAVFFFTLPVQEGKFILLDFNNKKTTK